MPEKLKFYDLKGRRTFTSSNYKLKTKGKTKFAVTRAPSGIQSWRIIGRVGGHHKKEERHHHTRRVHHHHRR